MYYAILYIGYGSNRHYQIRKVTERGTILPINSIPELFIAYKTRAEALKTAERYGLEIKKAGDVYQILPDNF